MMIRNSILAGLAVTNLATVQGKPVMECQGTLDADYKFELIDTGSRYVGELTVDDEKLPMEVCWQGNVYSVPGNIRACNNMDLTDRWNIDFHDGFAGTAAEIRNNEAEVGFIACEPVREPETVTVFNEDALKVIKALPELTKKEVAVGYLIKAEKLTCNYTRGFIWANCEMEDGYGGGERKDLYAAGADTLIRSLVDAGIPIKEHGERSIVTSSLRAYDVQCSEGGFIGIPMCTIKY